MRKINIGIVLAATAIIFAGCQQDGGIKIDRDKHMIKVNTRPMIVLYYQEGEGSLDNALTNAEFAKKIVRRLEKLGTTSRKKIELYLDDKSFYPYLLYYTIGQEYFATYPNRALVYGILQVQWNEWNPPENTFRRLPFEDIDNLFTRYSLNNAELDDVYSYTTRYLLQEMLFVSVQELMESQDRYFLPEQVHEVFFQIVTLPEITEFTRYIARRFGNGRLMKLANTEYSKENWKKMLGEEVNETEKQFTDSMENRKFNGVWLNPSFVGEFERMLELYNTGTKDTLFKK